MASAKLVLLLYSFQVSSFQTSIRFPTPTETTFLVIPANSFKLAGTIFTVLGQLLTGKLGFSAMGGTVTTITMTATAIQTGGFWYVLYMSSFIGVNLAVFNLLPFPALDGSRAVFTTIEWIRKKPIKRKVEGIIHAVGFVLLIVIAVLADLQRCF